MKCNLFFKHILRGHMRYKCKCCGEKTWHEFVENKTVIRTLNRSGKQRFGMFKQHYSCVIRATEYYLNEYSIYQCINCGRCYVHKCEKVADSPIESLIRNHTGNEQNIYVTRKCIDDDALKEMIKYSQRLEKYPFIKEGFEIFDNSPIYSNNGAFGNDGVRCLVVLECSDFVDDTCRRPKSQTDTKKDTDHYEGTGALSCMQETFSINTGRKKYSPPNY